MNTQLATNNSAPCEDNLRKGTNVPGWISPDMRKNLPPSLGVQRYQSAFPTVSPHERPTTFQSTSMLPQATPFVPMTANATTPWGIAQPNYPGDLALSPYGHQTHLNVPISAKKRRRVRKKPRKNTSSSSSCEGHVHTRGGPKCERRHVDSLSSGEAGHRGSSYSFDPYQRPRGHRSHSRSLSHGVDPYAYGAYDGPTFEPVLDRSSSDWGAVPPGEMKWAKRRGSFDLFADWKNSSHHTHKLVKRQRGCC